MQNFGVHTSCMSVVIMSAKFFFLTLFHLCQTYSYIIKHVKYALLNISFTRWKEHRGEDNFLSESRSRHNIPFYLRPTLLKCLLKMRGLAISLKNYYLIVLHLGETPWKRRLSHIAKVYYIRTLDFEEMLWLFLNSLVSLKKSVCG